jgi:Helicase HerA, central domain
MTPKPICFASSRESPSPSSQSTGNRIKAWIEENSDTTYFSVDALPGRKPSIHARLRQIIDAELEDEIHWSFRAVNQANPSSALTKLRSAIAASGLGDRRALVILRNAEWSGGAKTRETLVEFAARGGRTIALSNEDLRIFHALSCLLDEQSPGLNVWLRDRRPVSTKTFFGHVLPTDSSRGACPIPTQPIPSFSPMGSASNAKTASNGGTAPPAEPVLVTPGLIPIGLSQETGHTIMVKLEDLRRHTAIFAGSGSGKTVLIRRIIEECALQGVSSIVLDPNNDLSRLGTPWPSPPKDWQAGDADKAHEYYSLTDVVIWTPRLSAGRPLSFAPLGGLTSVSSAPDEFEIAIDNAVSALLLRAGLPAKKRTQGQAVLRQALKAFVLKGGDSLHAFLGYLSALPEGISLLADGEKLASDMAHTLIAETVNDSMFGGGGAAVDPSILLTPPKGMRARISVISLVGLPNADQRQRFVNQLQMALFAWVKKNPAGEKPLGGLFVMDEAQIFAPSSGATVSTVGTLALASQARKNGLGLLFSTQAPKGLHNQIPGNATTQFFGFLNASVQIQAAKEMALAKGGKVSGIAQLHPGEFFVAGDGLAFQRIRSPLCLSYHPKSPLTQEEIIKLAQR